MIKNHAYSYEAWFLFFYISQILEICTNKFCLFLFDFRIAIFQERVYDNSIKILINLRDDYIEKVVSDISISSDHQEVCNEKDPHHCNLASVHVLCFFAGGWTNQFAKDQYTMQDIASMMTTSFGWTIQSSKDVNAYQISLQDFCEMYNRLTNEDNSSGLAKSSGNIKGIDPHFLQESNIHIAGESKESCICI